MFSGGIGWVYVLYLSLSQHHTSLVQYIRYDQWLFHQRRDGKGACLRLSSYFPIPSVYSSPSQGRANAYYGPKAYPRTHYSGMSILELNIIDLDSLECVPAQVPNPKAFWALCFQALSWTFLLCWLNPASKLVYLSTFGPALVDLSNPASWLLFFTISNQFLDFHSIFSMLAPPPASEPMIPLTLWRHRLIVPSVVSTVGPSSLGFY